MSRIRVVVVEDSLTIRRWMVDLLSADPELEVAGEAADGKEGVEMCRALRPDAITLDMMMPVMNGLEVTEQVMAYFPTPILIVSSSVNRGEVFRTYDALAAGAVDVLEKPTADKMSGTWGQTLISTVKLISRIKVITHPKARLDARASRPHPPEVVRGTSAIRCVALGASTGGPAAIVEIFKRLPRDFPLPILVVIHLHPTFLTNFADWLSGQSALPVRFAADGEAIPPLGYGQVLLAPADGHLILKGGRLRFDSGPERNFCRPSVDVLFESLAAELGGQCAAVLLTGMGRDGAKGLLEIRRAGGFTVAQDEATSVVFGMPGEAIKLGAAEQVLPLNQIAPVLAGIAVRER